MKHHPLLTALLLLLPACSMLEPVKDTAVYHVLEPLVADRRLSAATPAIAIKRPSLPGYLDRQQLITRSAGQLMVSHLDLWAEPLDAAIARVMASNLSRLTGSMNIQPVENYLTLDYDTVLEIRLAQFEPDASNQLVLQGTWKLQPVTGRETSSHFVRIAVRIAVPVAAAASPMAGRVAAMNLALARLARQITSKN